MASKDIRFVIRKMTEIGMKEPFFLCHDKHSDKEECYWGKEDDPFVMRFDSHDKARRRGIEEVHRVTPLLTTKVSHWTVEEMQEDVKVPSAAGFVVCKVVDKKETNEYLCGSVVDKGVNESYWWGELSDPRLVRFATEGDARDLMRGRFSIAVANGATPSDETWKVKSIGIDGALVRLSDIGSPEVRGEAFFQQLCDMASMKPGYEERRWKELEKLVKAGAMAMAHEAKTRMLERHMEDHESNYNWFVSMLSLDPETSNWETIREAVREMVHGREKRGEEAARVRGNTAKLSADLVATSARVGELERAFLKEKTIIDAALGEDKEKSIRPWAQSVAISILRLRGDERGLSLMGVIDEKGE